MKQSNPKETSILGRIRSGDREVLIELYKAHEKMTIRHVIDNSGHAEDAQDMLQEALVVLWQNARKPEFDLTVKPSTYLNAVIKNLWLKQLSKRKYLKDESYISGKEVALNPNPIETLDYTLVHKALDNLGDTCRNILMMFYFDGFDMKTIAEAIGFANTDVAKSKKHQCMKQLEVIIKKSYNPLDFYRDGN